MSLAAGTRLGPYEIVGALGAGGMGEVYKDCDPERRARFEREARAVAALDHPHICGIHDVGDVDGTHFLVMPLVEGQTLAARLEKGPLPLDQAITTAREIADALDKAHRRGIVHRDLKPANIMLTDGQRFLVNTAPVDTPPGRDSDRPRLASPAPLTGDFYGRHRPACGLSDERIERANLREPGEVAIPGHEFGHAVLETQRRDVRIVHQVPGRTGSLYDRRHDLCVPRGFPQQHQRG